MGATEVPPHPLIDWDDGPISDGSLSVLSGIGVTLWCVLDPGQDTQPEYYLRLTHDRPAIVGRAEGREIEYLDPAYRPTTVVPGTGQPILRSGGQGEDRYVSRGHFMLRAAPGGILLVNGVPRRGGGIRPPLNGTWLVAPVRRALRPGEEYLIESGTAIVLRLPNDSVVQLVAR